LVVVFGRQQRLENSPDRLSLFGLMVKPVQRFPQFIMLLQVSAAPFHLGYVATTLSGICETNPSFVFI